MDRLVHVQYHNMTLGFWEIITLFLGFGLGCYIIGYSKGRLTELEKCPLTKRKNCRSTDKKVEKSS